MLYKTILSLSLLVGVSCKNQSDHKKTEIPNAPVTVSEKEEVLDYPEDLTAVFKAHGSLKEWKSKKSLAYKLAKKKGIETHTIDLKTRKTRIESEQYVIGFDGTDVWVNKEGKFPADRARFYHNLYFYFFTMPFIVADQGIIYEKTNPLTINGLDYPGIKISYKTGVGDSPDDFYFLYYHPETKSMEWLGYTVTYGTDTTSNEIHFIHYKDWQQVGGVMLPKTLQWYSSKDNLPDEAKSEVSFEEVFLTNEIIDAKLFEKPNDAVIGKK